MAMSPSIDLPRQEKTTGRTPMPLAYFVVRATVADAAKRKAFDQWYSREHLPDAAKAFGVNKAWRFWSVNDPSLQDRKSTRLNSSHSQISYAVFCLKKKKKKTKK